VRARLTFANVVSCIALFVALGGTSYAVIKLPRDSVGSREVKNRSLRSVDLAPGVVAKSRGPRGAQGPAGEAGARGPSDVVTANHNNSPLAAAAGSAVDAVTLNLPAGKWWLLGSGSAVYQDPGAAGSSYFRCRLTFNGADGAALSVARVGPDASADTAASLVVHEGRVLDGPTTVRLHCSHDEPLAEPGNPRIDHAQVSAIRTDHLDIQG
jgi:hypothetical protein